MLCASLVNNLFYFLNHKNKMKRMEYKMAVVLALVGHIASGLTLLLRMEENNFFYFRMGKAERCFNQNWMLA